MSSTRPTGREGPDQDEPLRLGHAYFRDGGRRAHGLHIAFSDVEFAGFSTG
ncbi:hypothetical protein [Streptomyces sp. NPDC096030]|uniref:hypothetical protein n=1 Tax=Streptomyces sp. NPDC096030 TaxID=3155423 RepID=UPI00332F2A72